MQLIDRYIFKKFIFTFVLFFLLLMMIAVVFDISEKVDDFIRGGAQIREIVLDYYVNFVAFYGNLFSSLILFLSTIFFTSKMASNTEIVPILTGGRSFRRLLWPYFLGAFFIFGASLAINHYVIPVTNVDRLAFEARYTHQADNRRTQQLYRQVKPGHLVYFYSFSPDRGSGYQFSYEEFDGSRLIRKLKADYARYDSLQARWYLDNWNIREIAPDGKEVIRQGRRMDTTLSFLPNDIVPKLYSTAMMTTPELMIFIDKEKLRGSENVKFHIIELHKRTAYPFSCFILVLIAVSLCSRKKRGGIGLNIAIGLILAVVYIFFMQISTTLSTHGNFSPVISVWTPNIVFAVLGLTMYRSAPK